MSELAQPVVHLKAWREFRGLTQEDVAQAMGCTPSFVSLLERGKKNWTVRRLVQAAHALGINPGHLLEADPREVTARETIWANIPDEVRDQALRTLDSFRRPDQP